MARTDATGRVPGSRGVAAVALAAITAACGGSTAGGIPEEAFPVVANADLAVGSQRLLVGLVTADGDWLPAADLPVEFDLYMPEAVEPSFTVDGVFLWTVPEVRGLYRADLTFESSGRWQIAAHSPGGPSTTVIPFDVAEDERAPSMGDRAPVVRTATAGEVADLSEITTDPNPIPVFMSFLLMPPWRRGSQQWWFLPRPGFVRALPAVRYSTTSSKWPPTSHW